MILALRHHDYFYLQCLAFFFVKVQTFDGFLMFHTESITHNIKHVQVLALLYWSVWLLLYRVVEWVAVYVVSYFIVCPCNKQVFLR